MDLAKIIEELIGRGMTQVTIAAKVGSSQATISAIVNGKYGPRGPSFGVASALLDLHKAVMAEPAAEPAKAA